MSDDNDGPMSETAILLASVAAALARYQSLAASVVLIRARAMQQSVGAIAKSERLLTTPRDAMIHSAPEIPALPDS